MSVSKVTELRVQLNQPQWAAFHKIKPQQTVNLAWGRGVGKSFFLRFLIWYLVSEYDGKLRTNALKPFRGVRIVGLMPTLKQFKDIHRQAIETDLQDDWAFLGGKLDRSTMRLDFPGGSWFQPFPAEVATSKRARGLRADVVLGDEIDDIDVATWDAIARPWFSEPWSLKYRISAGTPTRGRRGLLYQLHKLGQSEDPKHARYHSLHATYRDAPGNVDASEVEDARIHSASALFAREWECDFDSAEGLVLPMFSHDLHVREPPENIVWREVHVGADYGWEDPGVFLKLAIAGSGRDTVVWALDEIYESKREEDWWCDQAKRWNGTQPGMNWYHDPSMPGRIAALTRKGGCKMQSADNAIEDGVSVIANLMAVRDREDGTKVSHFFVSPKCKNFIREIGLYRHKRDPKAIDKFSDTIEDRDNHTIDSARYVLLTRFGRPEPRRIDRGAETYLDG